MTFKDIYNLCGSIAMYLLLFSNHRIAIDRMGEREQEISLNKVFEYFPSIIIFRNMADVLLRNFSLGNISLIVKYKNPICQLTFI